MTNETKWGRERAGWMTEAPTMPTSSTALSLASSLRSPTSIFTEAASARKYCSQRCRIVVLGQALRDPILLSLRMQSQFEIDCISFHHKFDSRLRKLSGYQMHIGVSEGAQGL